MVTPPLRALILAATGARELGAETPLQTLWGGYGQISRLYLQGGEMPSVILKRVSPPAQRPLRESLFSHQRKLSSYAIERRWYRDWSGACAAACRVPRCYGVQEQEGLLLLEDLDAAGFAGRLRRPGTLQLGQMLRWLAHFHARFLEQAPTGLWPEGSYWHLATRPDEWAALAEGPLKHQAAELDQRLRAARFRTLIHGDAKPANFCFGADTVAAVDFQYVGGGCGLRDVAYLLSCCPETTGTAAADWVETQLTLYFEALRSALRQTHPQVSGAALEAEWRSLFAVAWTDFQRFLGGWQGAPAQLDAFSRQQAFQALGAAL